MSGFVSKAHTGTVGVFLVWVRGCSEQRIVSRVGWLYRFFF